MIAKRNILVGTLYKEVILRLVGRLYKPKIFGLENIPKEPVIFASNHKTLLDAPLIEIALRDRDREISWVYRVHGGSIKWKLIDWFSRKLGNILVERDVLFSDDARVRAGYQVLRGGEEVLMMGNDVGIFPEGRLARGDYVREDGLWRFNGGASRLSMETDRGIVPVYINQDELVKSTEIRFGKVINPKGYTDRRDLSTKVRDSVLNLKNNSI